MLFSTILALFFGFVKVYNISQSKGFTQKYNPYTDELKKYLEKTESFTMTTKRERLWNKRSYITCNVCKEKI